MKVTIKDIAKRANVSVSAVSFALNDKSGVSPKTKQLILEIAAEMGYVHTPAKSVRFNKNNAVVKVLKIVRHGHTINENHNFFIDSYIEGITETALERGVTIEVGTYNCDVPIETIAEAMNQYQPTLGYLVVATELSPTDVEILLATDNKIVFLDTFYDYINAHFVTMNNTDSVYKALSHLKEYGHKEIGFIKSSVVTNNFALRERAFYQVMRDLDLSINEEYIVDVDSTYEGSYEDMRAHLKENKALPTAFFVTNDIMAMGCMKALLEAGYKIPQEISIVGFDDLPMAKMSNPSVTTIEVNNRKIAKYALNILLSLVENGHPHCPIKAIVDGSLVIRFSVEKLSL